MADPVLVGKAHGFAPMARHGEPVVWLFGIVAIVVLKAANKLFDGEGSPAVATHIREKIELRRHRQLPCFARCTLQASLFHMLKRSLGFILRCTVDDGPTHNQYGKARFLLLGGLFRNSEEMVDEGLHPAASERAHGVDANRTIATRKRRKIAPLE